MNITKELKDVIRNLRLTGIITTLPDRISNAQKNSFSFEEFLEVIFHEEWERRQNMALNRKIKRAGVEEHVEVYDWQTTTKYDRQLARSLMTLDFIQNHYSVLIFGPTGVGKTFLVKHLALCALKGGYDVVFVRADKMFRHLLSCVADGTHEKALKFYIKPDVLVIDDFATRAITMQEAQDLYEIVLERHQKKSTIVTSARAVDEWQEFFHDAILSNSLLDRLAHSSYQLLMEGESIRKQNRPK